VPTFNQTLSSVTYRHDYQIGDGPPDAAMVVGGDLIPFGIPGVVFTSMSPPGPAESSANAGVGRTEQVDGVGMTVNAGELFLSQTDGGDSIPFSVLEIHADLWWDVDTGNFGPPLTGGFNLPLSPDVPLNGSAEVDFDIHWNARVAGRDCLDVRSAVVGGRVFTAVDNGLDRVPLPPVPNAPLIGLPSFPPQILRAVGPADLNVDGKVDLSDAGIVVGNFGQALSGEANGDTTGDNHVGSDDLDIVLGGFGREPNRINVNAKLTFRINAASEARLAIPPTDEVFIGVAALPGPLLTLDKNFDDPTVTINDLFSASVAMAGNYVLIGAPHH
jgi:hypothetical protein